MCICCSDVTVLILDRPRHADIIKEVTNCHVLQIRRPDWNIMQLYLKADITQVEQPAANASGRVQRPLLTAACSGLEWDSQLQIA